MKKIISLILSGVMLTSIAFAAEIGYDKPDKKINDKITSVLTENKNALFNELYYTDKAESTVK